MLTNSFVIDLDLVIYLIGGGLDFDPSSCVSPNMLWTFFFSLSVRGVFIIRGWVEVVVDVLL